MSHCRKCHHRHTNNQVDYRYYLIGNLIENFLYQPPIHNQSNDQQQTINLKDVIYIRICNVQDTYGHLEKKGILFQLKSKLEIQVNYCSEKEAASEYNVLTTILSCF